MKKIYLVSEYILPTQNTTGYLFHKLHKNLKKNYGDRLQLIVKADKHHFIKDAILVNDVSLNKKKLIQRFLFEVIISFKFLFKILFHIDKHDVVFTGTTPIFLLPVIYIAKKLKRFKWVLLVHDVFPENLIAAKVLRPKNIIYRFLKYCFDIFYAQADKRIVIGRDMKDLIDGKVGIQDSIVIQNWIDHHDIQTQSKSENNILRKLNWQNEKIVFNFFGNIGRVQGIDNIIEALKILAPQDRPKVLFIGSGAYEKELKASLDELNDPNIQYFGPLDPVDKSDGLNACDISIVTLSDGMYGLGVPSKAYYSMAADKSILAIMDMRSEICTMVEEHKLGWTVSPGSPDLLAKKMLEIQQNFNQKNINSPLKVLIDNYSEPIAMKKIIAVIEDVL